MKKFESEEGVAFKKERSLSGTVIVANEKMRDLLKILSGVSVKELTEERRTLEAAFMKMYEEGGKQV